VLVEQARWCNTFASRLRGFTLKRALQPGEGLVLVDSSDNRINTALTMVFVFFDLGIIWVNSAGEVVDSVLARPWRLSYAPKVPARYTIEADPGIIDMVSLGDHITFD